MKNSIEWEVGFDTYYNNITSNQAAGLNIHEKSLFLTRAEYEIVSNYAIAQSKGNTTGVGLDDSAKRQADFSSLMATAKAGPLQIQISSPYQRFDGRSSLYNMTKDAEGHKLDLFVITNETFTPQGSDKVLQIVPLTHEEYTRLMSKPFKRPIKGQAWRLNTGVYFGQKVIEVIAGPGTDNGGGDYIIRYLRRPKPIILGDLDGLSIDGYIWGGDTTPVSPGANMIYGDNPCEIDESLHEAILQRAVELAKISWTQTGQDNTQLVMAAGQRSE